MKKSWDLAPFEAVIIGAVIAAGDDAYGVMISDQAEKIVGREPTSGALYTTLGRLVEKDLLIARESPPTPERGGRRKFVYEVTGAGRRCLRQYLDRAKRLELAWGNS